MSKILSISAICLALLIFLSCDNDEGKLPDISFKTGGSYVSSDVTLDGSAAFTVGINASKTEDKDVLKQFNISKSVNGAANTSVFNKSLSGAEGDNFSFDFNSTVDNNPGQKSKYTFTITNRDGLTNQVALTVITK
jgi:hypothetical protein